MPIPYGQHLIWQSCAPAPFESAWSIFSKLMALNNAQPHRIASMIAGSGMTLPRRGGLNFRKSAWIDFERFSNALNVNQQRLRFAFLDQLGFELPESSIGIKICPNCLSKGYHCIFFELGFIDTCPWHQQKLEEPCGDCVNAVSHRGLINLNTNRKEKIEPEEWCSKCNHTHFRDGDIRKLNQLSAVQEEVILWSCQDFLKWWQKVALNAGLAKCLTGGFHSRLNTPDILNKFFNAAETLAGPCPWPVGQARKKIRSHTWRQEDLSQKMEEYWVARKSPGDSYYRSVRRHIFNRFVRSHRACWNELINYSQADTQFLDSDTACPVALAYASWRMATEGFTNIRALKTNSLRDKPIRLMGLSDAEHVNTLESHSSLLYAHFLFVWESIFRFSGEDSYAIASSSFYDDYLATIFISDNHNSDSANPAGEWTVVLPDHQSLVNRSFICCSGRLKTEAWMIYPSSDSWYAYLEIDLTPYKGALFKLKKDKGRHRRAQYHYINI